MSANITTRCYGGPWNGRWVTVGGNIFVVPAQWPPQLDADLQEILPTITYMAMWIRPLGWRVAFPVFVCGLVSGNEAARQVDATYRSFDHWPLNRELNR